MTHFHEKQKIQEQEVLSILQRYPVRMDVLRSCQQIGMTSQAFAELVAQVEYRQVYSALEWLVSPGRGLLPLLSAVPMRLAGRAGRPPIAYPLTEFGASVLSLLDPELPVQAPILRDVSDLHHRFCQLEILTRATQAGIKANVEAVLPYERGQRNIRCDVVLKNETNDWYIEVEQELSRNNLQRAVAKFEHWQGFAHSSENKQPLRLVLLFNLPQSEAHATITSWREARARCEGVHGPLHFEVSFLLMAGIFADTWLEMLMSAPALEPLAVAKPALPTQENPIVQSLTSQEIPNWMRPVFTDYQSQFYAFREAHDPQEHFMLFLNLMHYIYSASHYPDSPTMLYSVHPRESLWLLRHYLNLPHNQPMLEELQEALGWIQKRSGQMGLIMFRDAMSRLLWDVFMRHHGFSRGGALGIIFQIPDFQDIRSDYWVDVRLMNFRGMRISRYQFEMLRDGLSWVLSSLFIYAEELELGKRPWRQTDKKKKPLSKEKK